MCTRMARRRRQTSRSLACRCYGLGQQDLESDAPEFGAINLHHELVHTRTVYLETVEVERYDNSGLVSRSHPWWTSRLKVALQRLWQYGSAVRVDEVELEGMLLVRGLPWDV